MYDTILFFLSSVLVGRALNRASVKGFGVLLWGEKRKKAMSYLSHPQQNFALFLSPSLSLTTLAPFSLKEIESLRLGS